MMNRTSPPSRTGRSILAVFAGLLAVVVLSIATDEILRAAGIFPPASQRMPDKLFLLATAYRTVYGALGGYIAARLAPYRPLSHALVLGSIGFAVALAGFVATREAGPELGPRWYSLAIILIALPSAWLGGTIQARKTR
jgi:hypothetical protein